MIVALYKIFSIWTILLTFGGTFVSYSIYEKCGLEIPFFNQDIIVDGVIYKGEWETKELVEGLIAPWETIRNDKTRFNAFCSNDYFNFSFQVVDSTIVTYNFIEELTVAKEDRVEIFFSTYANLSQYYCIEIDPLGRVLDYSARYHRIFDESWDFKDIEIKTQLTCSGYTVEGRISLDELNEPGIQTEFFTGIFRADFKKTGTEVVTWYSLIKPQSEIPDFHISSAFSRSIFL